MTIYVTMYAGADPEQKIEGLNYTVSSTSNHLGIFSLSFMVKKIEGGAPGGIHGFCGCRGPPAPTLDPPLHVWIFLPIEHIFSFSPVFADVANVGAHYNCNVHLSVMGWFHAW